MASSYNYHKYRAKALPDLVAAAERKLLGLYRECERVGRQDLLSHKCVFDAAWEAEIKIAKIEAQLAGEDSSLEGL